MAAEKRLARARELGAPDAVINGEAFTADPRQATLDALDRGDCPEVVAFAESARQVISSDNELEWALGVATFGAGGRQQQESEAHRHLWGSTRCVISGQRLFPHWRTQCGWSEDMLKQTRESLGPTWDLNWHDENGVLAALDYFRGAKRRQPPGVEHGRALPEVQSRESMGVSIEDWEMPWYVAAAPTLRAG
jgi:hypothetical protein